MREKVIREYVRKIISNKLSENSKLTQEGIVSGVLNHISGILKKANDKRFQKSLEDLAASGPDGKKAAEHLMKSLEIFDDAADHVNDKLKSLGFEK
jgi:Na+/phosphate symporter